MLQSTEYSIKFGLTRPMMSSFKSLSILSLIRVVAGSGVIVKEGSFACAAQGHASRPGLIDVSDGSCRMSMDLMDDCVTGCSEHCQDAGKRYAEIFGSQCSCFDTCTMEEILTPATWGIVDLDHDATVSASSPMDFTGTFSNTQDLTGDLHVSCTLCVDNYNVSRFVFRSI